MLERRYHVLYYAYEYYEYEYYEYSIMLSSGSIFDCIGSLLPCCASTYNMQSCSKRQDMPVMTCRDKKLYLPVHQCMIHTSRFT